MDGVVEIVTGRERRRRWSVQEKLRLVGEMDESGAVVRAVAARHGVCESLLFTLRRQEHQGVLTSPREVPGFIPVHMIDAAPSSAPRPSSPATPPRPAAPPGLIEIELGNGQHVRVGRDVNLAALRRVLAALRE
jgi:transposase